ncbi:MAG: 2'-5' RNA ligase family protein [Nitrososphaerota archaeon]|nr:2'-5' RNA ligase family protein [Nitrososphaerota archaeon]MDG6904024.1 2'-5' RNA ligase family protein [Nitrososphaerota archaeon]MDG6911489.1 2'-5' RNA ligase family protein [Nitrososphaerota archaeon]MDG6940391.1 2'-5' RNA ligase family protein [Nitrososphaerota archaeon]MDG6960705.1 2'-5' RNA ligase family protein [Nitrososphaerota archaeon]
MLIELRIRPGDYWLRSILKAVRLEGLVRHGKVHRVPHLSLYGNARVPPGGWPELRYRVAELCSKYRTLPYLVDDYDSRMTDEGKVVAFRVVHSNVLKTFRRDLVRSLGGRFPSEKAYDSEDVDPWFHITVAHKLPDHEFERVWAYLHERESRDRPSKARRLHVNKYRPYQPLNGLRVTILNDVGRIDREYDLGRQKFLTREEALSRHGWCGTYKAYRISRGVELTGPQFSRTPEPETYFISDLHLDHGNIIRYCSRPFCSVQGMNRVLVNNWNSTVRDMDRVYFLGDLTFGREHRPDRYWWNGLKGDKVFVKGNHQDSTVPGVLSSKFSVPDGREGETRFVAVHDPREMQNDLRGWVEKNNAWIIHGHHHNNDLRNHPFIEGERRMINVSAEVVDYKPVSLTLLMSLGLNGIQKMDTITSVPERL